MTNNLLKLNEDKTELIIVTSRDSISKEQNITINIGGHTISPSDTCPKNLGVVFDSTCSLKQHVSNICKSINFNLYSIGKVRRYLDQSTTEKMVNALITSRMDYCNSLMYGMNQSLVDRLQRCQNHAARIITLRRKYDHISPVLCDLHWLRVKYRIQFKVLLLTYKALNGMAPIYLKDLLVIHAPVRSLRSQNDNLLLTPRYRLDGYGKRSFAVAAPFLWNSLPIDIKKSPSLDIFKRRLKTHLFINDYFN